MLFTTAYRRFEFTGLMLIVLAFLVPAAHAGIDKKGVESLRDDFNTEFRAVRPEFLAYPNYTLIVAGQDYACHIPRSLRRLGAAGESFRIRKLHIKRIDVRLEMETPGKTRVTLRLQDRDRMSQEFLDQGVATLLNEVFAYGPPPEPRGFVGHKTSRLLHLDRCNHLPPASLQERFSERDTALAAGYRDCAVCIAADESLPYDHYLSHRTQGLTSARTFELVYPPADDPALTERVRSLGKLVLDGWPMELAGFDYDFRVVEADLPLAVSFRTGIVIVSDMLLDVAEADEEILFVLAHEIAHCELHLPPRSPYGSSGIRSSSAYGYGDTRSWAGNVQIVADLVAIQWFRAQPEGRWDLRLARAALAKVQFAAGESEQMLSEGAQDWGLHQRLQAFDGGHFRLGDPHAVSLGVDGEEDVRFEARLLGLHRNDKGKVRALMLLTATDYAEKVELGSNSNQVAGHIRDDQGKEWYFRAGPYLVNPGYTTHVVGEFRKDEMFDDFRSGPQEVIVLQGLSGVKSWWMMQDE